MATNHRRKLYYAVSTAINSNDFDVPAIVITDGTVAGTPDRYSNLLEVNGLTNSIGYQRQAITAIFQPSVVTLPTANVAGTVEDYGYWTNLENATVVAPEAAYVFNVDGAFTSGFTHAAGSTDIVVVNPGTYMVEFNVTGAEVNQAALFLADGGAAAAVSNTVYGTKTTNTETTGFAIITTVNAGAILTLRNHTSVGSVTPVVNAGGTALNVVNSLLIKRLGVGGGATFTAQGQGVTSVRFLNAVTSAPVTDPATVAEVSVIINVKGMSGGSIAGTLYVQKQHSIEA